MWLVVGLGNPGPKYERNRHNVGFRVVDELARRHALGAWKGNKLGGDATSGLLATPGGRVKATLLKPMEYMNLSGFAVQKTAAFHDVPVERIAVVHDEIDLDFGTIRVKVGGGHGGHNGLRSMIDQLGDNAFTRVRWGVGKPGPQAGTASGGDPRAGAGDKNVAGWVLADFPSAQQSDVDTLINRAADAIEAILGRGAKAAMNDFNSSSLASNSRA
ncbi:MAG TPA: aminoacyl-tRNA hydrolase [Kofleriaceae bacterium]|nr:aminoacyl-tRNA hydrolase [Kofleriaceae bacterium]